MAKSKKQNAYLPLFALLTAAVLIGISEPFFEAVGYDAAWNPAWGTLCSACGFVLLLVIFRRDGKTYGSSGFFLGLGLGLLLFMILFCLQKGGFGIGCLAAAPLLLAADYFGEQKIPSYRDVAALPLWIGAGILLTGTVSVTLFPFAVDISLPDLKEQLFWQIAASVLSAAYFLLCKKITAQSGHSLQTAGQLAALCICFLLCWYWEDRLVFPMPDGKQAVLFVWCALMLATVTALLIVYGISYGRLVQGSCVLFAALPIAMTMQMLLGRSLAPDFNGMAGSLLLVAAILTAQTKTCYPPVKKKK